ncbi:MAG: hypothetical protein GX616_10815 [Planctomycetes bacterium]|nr:hypothetical protein [Planctomycetota bacterium]
MIGQSNFQRARLLTIDQILAWMDAHRERTGYWPHSKSGKVYLAPSETWRGLDKAQRMGRQGLPGGFSLARLLPKRQGRRDRRFGPPPSIKDIPTWADTHRKRTGRRPNVGSGYV